VATPIGDGVSPLTAYEHHPGGNMRRLVEGIWFLAVLLVITALGIFLVHSPVRGLDFEFSKAVGHALIVAAVLGVTVDVYVKKRLVKEVAHDTFKYLVGFRLPEELQDKIQEVAETKLIRRDWHFHYAISPIDGVPDKIRLDATLTFCIENISRRSQEYAQRIALATYNEPKITELRCDTEDPDARYVLDEQGIAEQIKERGEVKENLFLQAVGKQIKLKPHKSGGDLKYEFRTKYSQTVPANHLQTFTFDSPGIPTKNVIITAQYPSGFQFYASGESKNKDRWDDKRIFLNGEHIFIAWTKVK
jgi:hypothetical protein